MHVRTQIRAAVVARLQGLTQTQDRVYPGESRPLAERHRPTLLVYTPLETIVRSVAGRPPVLERELTLHVEVRVVTDAEPDDLLDEIAGEVEAALLADRGIGGLLSTGHMQFVDSRTTTRAAGQYQQGGLRLEFRLTYRTGEGAPDIAV